MRLLGGVLYFAGMLVMAWNVWKTALPGQIQDVRIPAVNPAHA
jgi:cytochrome c oxidase cbb3-type subunit 1